MSHYIELVNAVRVLPRNAEVVWGDDAELSVGVLTDWIDVHAPALCESLEINWAWTIVSPAEATRRDSTVIALPYDWTVVTGREPGRIRPVDQYVYAVDDPRLPSRLRTANQAMRAAGLNVSESGGWTPARVSRALGLWTREHVGRQDLRFVFNAAVTSGFANAIAEHTLSSDAAAEWNRKGLADD